MGDAESNDGISPTEETADPIQMEPVTYTKAGEVCPSLIEHAGNISVPV